MLKWVHERLSGDPNGAPALVRRLLTDFALIHWRSYVTVYALMGVAAGCTAISAYLIGRAINETHLHRNFAATVAFCMAILLLFAAKGFVGYVQSILLARITNRIVADIRKGIFNKLSGESLAFFAEHHSSEYAGNLHYAAMAGPGMITLVVSALGGDVLSIVFLWTVMVTQDSVTALAALAVLPLIVLLMRPLVLKVRAVARQLHALELAIFERLQETLQGLRVIKAFTLEGLMRRRVQDLAERSTAAADERARLSSRSAPIMDTLQGFVIALVFLYGSYRMLHADAAPGEMLAFVAAFLLAYEPAKRLAQFPVAASNMLVGVRILYEILDAPEFEAEDRAAPSLAASAGRVEFDRVEFSYRPGEKVIRGMSFVAEAGESTALVGPSGSGKSTVLNLILRFYDPECGRIRIDGQDLAPMSRRSVRQQISYVGQETQLFRGSIRDNIAFGRPDADERAIIDAAEAAQAHEFIVALPLGYDTQVHEQGLNLSAGQRQRLAVARALVKNAPIILLDEPTASLDSESEWLLQNSIARLTRGRTTIVVAHRLHTILNADCIYFIEDGMIVESGRHEELLRRGGRYARFHQLQFGAAMPNVAARKAHVAY